MDSMMQYGMAMATRLRILIVSSSSRPKVSALTRPSLQRFRDAHSHRYELIEDSDILIDDRDFALSWNKLAVIKRWLLIGDFDAIVWIDDDILVTDPASDPIYEALSHRLFVQDRSAYVLMTVDGSTHATHKVDCSILAFRRGSSTINLIDSIFRIGRTRQLTNSGPSFLRLVHKGLEEAFAFYANENGFANFAMVPPGLLWAKIGDHMERPWRRGDFAAQLSASDLDEQVDYLKDALRD